MAYKWICNEPFNVEIANWGRQNYKPFEEEKRKILKQKLSESAFGSSKYPNPLSFLDSAEIY